MDLGKTGELKAVAYLDRKGYQILQRNFRCRFGEIDVIAMDGDVLCFIEVKTRTTLRHGLPCEAVTEKKMLHIRRCAQVYLSRHRPACRGVRIDVAEVLLYKGSFYVRIIRNAGAW